MNPSTCQILIQGEWVRGQIVHRWVESTHRLPASVEALVEQEWALAKSRLGDRLFDGPMCRLEGWQTVREALHLDLSRTSYRPFLGTNLTHPELLQTHGRDVLANPVGVSCALISADGYVLMGRRNDRVAYYPRRVHPFAGALEPREPLCVFDEAARELREELGLLPEDLSELCGIALVEDPALLQPELIFRVRTKRTLHDIHSQLDPTEHDALWSVRLQNTDIQNALASEDLLTPVARAALITLRSAPSP